MILNGWHECPLVITAIFLTWMFATTIILPRAKGKWNRCFLRDTCIIHHILTFFVLPPHRWFNSLIFILAFNFTNTLSYFFLPSNCLRQQKVHRRSQLRGKKKALCAVSPYLHKSSASSGSSPSCSNDRGPDSAAVTVTFLLHWTKVMWG